MPRRFRQKDFGGKPAAATIVCAALEPGHPDYPDLVSMLAYWNGKRAGRLAPPRREIAPEEIVRFLPRVKLADVLREADGTLDFRFRLSGTEIGNILGAELTHSRARDLQPPQFGAMVHAHYLQCATEKRPLLHRIDFETGIRVLSYARLLLPLSEDGESVDMLMTVDSEHRNRRPAPGKN